MPSKRTLADDVSGHMQHRRSLPMDYHVGSRIRLRRAEIAMSAEVLGQKIGSTRQQVEKYERGQTRLSIGRLWVFAQALGVSPSYFLDSFEGDGAVHGPSSAVITPIMLELSDSYSALSVTDRRMVRAIIRRLAAAGPAPAEEEA
jgi:transcriptional regulator with XRE-family HTH domain